MLILTSASTGTQRGTRDLMLTTQNQQGITVEFMGKSLWLLSCVSSLCSQTTRGSSRVASVIVSQRQEDYNRFLLLFHIQNGNFKTFSSIAEEGGISLQSFYMEGREKSLVCWFLSSIRACGRWRQENKCSYLQLHLSFKISLGYMNLRLVWVT